MGVCRLNNQVPVEAELPVTVLEVSVPLGIELSTPTSLSETVLLELSEAASGLECLSCQGEIAENDA